MVGGVVNMLDCLTVILLGFIALIILGWRRDIETWINSAPPLNRAGRVKIVSAIGFALVFAVIALRYWIEYALR